MIRTEMPYDLSNPTDLAAYLGQAAQAKPQIAKGPVPRTTDSVPNGLASSYDVSTPDGLAAWLGAAASGNAPQIASSSPTGTSPPAPPPDPGLSANIAAGANRTIYSAAAALPDAANWLANQPIRGINRLFGANIPLFDTDIEQSQIAPGAAALGVPNPYQIEPQTEGERIGSAVGGAVASIPLMALGGAGLGGAAPALGGIAPAAEAVGRGLKEMPLAKSIAPVATGAAMGQAASDSSYVPAPYKPLANLAGNLVGGSIAGLAQEAVPAIARGALTVPGKLGLGSKETMPLPTGDVLQATPQQFQSAARAVYAAGGEPLRQTLNIDPLSRMAADLQERINNPVDQADADDAAASLKAVRSAMAARGNQYETVPGERPLTSQVAPIPGVQQLARAMAQRPDEEFGAPAFLSREAQRNNSRLNMIAGQAGEVDASTYGEYLASEARRLADEDAQERALATIPRNEATGALNTSTTPEDAGNALREGQIEAYDQQRKSDSANFWNKIPDDLTSDFVAPKQLAQVLAGQARAEVPSDAPEDLQSLGASANEFAYDPSNADQVHPYELNVLQTIAGKPDVVPFRDVQRLMGAVSAAKRAVRMSPDFGSVSRSMVRLNMLSGSLMDSLSDGAAQRILAEKQAVDAGEMQPEDTLAATLNRSATGVGPFGPIYDRFQGDPQGAIKQLMATKSGEATGALYHPQIGPIDLVWGREGTGRSDGYGLAKIAKYHPEVIDNLQSTIAGMRVASKSDNRINLESQDHRAAVRLDWDKGAKNWLVTAFRKKNPGGTGTTTDTAGAEGLGDTARQATSGDDEVSQTIRDFYQNQLKAPDTAAIQARLAQEAKDWYNSRNGATQTTTGRQNSQGARGIPGALGSPASAGVDGAEISPRRQSGQSAGSPGVPGASGARQPVTSHVTPEAAAALEAARRATAVTKSRFSQSVIGDILKPGRGSEPYALRTGAQVMRRIFSENGAEPENIKQFIANAGNKEQAGEILKNYMLSEINRAGIVKPDGALDIQKYEAFVRKRAGTLAHFPEVWQKLGTAREAQETLDQIAADGARRIKDFQSGVAKKFLGRDTQAAINDALAAKNSAESLSHMIDAVHGNADALDALKSGVVQFMLDRFASEAKAANGTERGFLSPVAFRKWIGENRTPLRRLFGGQGMQNFDMVRASLQHEMERAQAVKGSQSTPNILNAAKHGIAKLGHPTMLTTIGAMLGEQAAEHLGGHELIGMSLGAIAAPVIEVLRHAGIETVNDIKAAAMLHPEFAKALLQRVPEGGRVPNAALGRLGVAAQAVLGAQILGSKPGQANATNHN